MSVAESVYGRLPVLGQNIALSIFGLRYRNERLGGDFNRHVAAFVDREAWDAERLGAYCEERLRAVLAGAFTETTYYRERWSEAGIGRGDLERITLADLRKLPTTPKDDVRSNAKALVSSKARKQGGLRSQRTSGSTGTPTTIFLTSDIARRFMAAREARSFGWAGVSVKLPRATIGARLVVPRTDDEAPYYRARAAILGSEKVWPQMREIIKAGLGVRAFEEYGAVENCVLATECEHGRLHVSPDFGVLEILDDSGRPSPPGVPGRVVCTGLINNVQPLVRYEIGDVAAWARESCPCGRDHLPVLEGIVGRQNDVILTSDGRRIIGGDEIFSDVEHVVEGQIIQESIGHFTVRLVPAAGFGLPEEERLRNALRRRIGDVDVTIEAVDRLERTNAGKFKPVVNKLLAD